MKVRVERNKFYVYFFSFKTETKLGGLCFMLNCVDGDIYISVCLCVCVCIKDRSRAGPSGPSFQSPSAFTMLTRVQDKIS